MSGSRIVSLIGIAAAVLSVLGAQVGVINPEVGIWIAGAGAALAAFSERVQGGSSTQR